MEFRVIGFAFKDAEIKSLKNLGTVARILSFRGQQCSCQKIQIQSKSHAPVQKVNESIGNADQNMLIRS